MCQEADGGTEMAERDGIVDVLSVAVARVRGAIDSLDGGSARDADRFVRDRYRSSRISPAGTVIRMEIASGITTSVLVDGVQMDLVIEVRGRRADMPVPPGQFAEALARFAG
ncbi:hypothetical protein [Acidipropionibacterium jensenii]|nr:hypothetical protein [Acidipropionibacterium jensenii]MDN5995541.1 hypothetical protein [Acidipropionibacterium jensenii]MDN6441008.1 hypothetical protein [Acidipropionibacterium jensenii]MDN6592064.1 hypothetical protein [Acidipropionibacterium jensenii]MDN6761104.1 hypothetical protein [Acidipropionibacterium jensenii]